MTITKIFCLTDPKWDHIKNINLKMDIVGCHI